MSIESQAREWLIRLDGDEPLSSAERQQLRDWLDGDPRHRRELTRLSRFWKQANVLTELAVPLTVSESRPTRSLPLLGFWAATAISLLIVTGTVLWHWYG